EIEAGAARGRNIALCHVNSFEPEVLHRELIAARFQQLVHDGKARLVTLDDDIECALVLVRDPRALQFVPARASAIRASRACIAAGHTDGRGAGRQDYDIEICAQLVEQLFGCRPDWVSGYTMEAAPQKKEER